MKKLRKTNIKKYAAVPKQKLKDAAADIKSRIHTHSKTSPHRSFRITRRSEMPEYMKIPAWWKLAAHTMTLLTGQWRKVLALIAIYVPIAWIISGVYSQDFGELKTAVDVLSESSLSATEEALALFVSFFNTQNAGIARDSLVLINVFTLIFWLSFVWLARYAYAKKQTTVREALYTSGAAVIPFTLLILLLAFQLVPAIVANVIFTNIGANVFALGSAELALILVLAILLIILSLYFVISNIIALQIVALPGMYPWRALRNARRLVTGRRFSVLRKLFMLLIFIGVTWLLLFTPVLIADNAICGESGVCWSTITLIPIAYYALIGLTVAFASTYLYVVYRSLLNEKE